MELRGMTLVYGPAGAGKTTLTAWYVSRYEKVFWVSIFEDRDSFLENMKNLGIVFKELSFWEAPLADVESFIETLLGHVVIERPGALVIDSITGILGATRLEVLHNVVYRTVKQLGVDVFLTAERDVAEKVTYIADNVVELSYNVTPFGAMREVIVKKVRGGRAGYTIPFLIHKEGVVFLAQRPESYVVDVIQTGTCLDEAAGGLYKGVLTAVIGPMGAGKTSFMLKIASSLKRLGREAAVIDMGNTGAIYVARHGVRWIGVDLNLEELIWNIHKLADGGVEAVFIRGLDLVSILYDRRMLYGTLRILGKMARRGVAVVVSLRDIRDVDILFDVVVQVDKDKIEAVRTPVGKAGEVKC